MSTQYYVTSCKRSDGWRWQVRTGAYPSATIEYVADDAVAAHVWAEGRGYTLLTHSEPKPMAHDVEIRYREGWTLTYDADGRTALSNGATTISTGSTSLIAALEWAARHMARI